MNMLSNTIGIVYIDPGHSFYKKQSRSKGKKTNRKKKNY
jgi:hypothetical protein